ncbi:hypothetical protein HanXRQr2_Chr17g0799581 [Helianthus annuus]|uniref:Uncharacterized protein n=1 Tax=Helianthus annuus TaxID=4232 RepID=A0A9K3DJM5_HELAN|nr:hypothetical protein HanXRQr2_Chr17g0799581 [Helianthus annuus]
MNGGGGATVWILMRRRKTTEEGGVGRFLVGAHRRGLCPSLLSNLRGVILCVVTYYGFW